MGNAVRWESVRGVALRGRAKVAGKGGMAAGRVRPRGREGGPVPLALPAGLGLWPVR